MIGIDTNVLLRFLVDDDPAQNSLARSFMAERTAEDPAYIGAIVLSETVCFLVSRLGYTKKHVIDLLDALLQSGEVLIEHSDALRSLIADSKTPIADVADHLIAWSAIKSGCTRTVTFDKKAAARVPGMELLT
jgi:predicted nucleic-acid-binding protein